VIEEATLERLIAVKEKWSAQYPAAIKNWEDNWDIILYFINIQQLLEK
jgi:transposase-like protein